MSLKVKELKEDALVSVTVNKNFYMMVKNSLFYIVQQMNKDEVDNLKWENAAGKVVEVYHKAIALFND